MSWINTFPVLSSLDEVLRCRVESASHLLHLPPNSIVFEPGRTPDSLLLVLTGQVRVQQMSEQGREIVLYRIAAGESCMLTTACLLAAEDYQATAIAESDVTAAAIPRATFDQLIVESATFRKFVFGAFNHRLAEMFKVVEDVAFARLDVRLAQRLLSLGDTTGYVHKTHYQLAAELGKAREVVSRQLKDFEDHGLVKLKRGGIQILDRFTIIKLSHQGRGEEVHTRSVT